MDKGEYMTPSEAAQHFTVTARTIRNWILWGVIVAEAVQFEWHGRRRFWYIKKSEIERLKLELKDKWVRK